jgi:hypothetical protein
MMAVTTSRSGNNNITATTTTTDRERERERRERRRQCATEETTDKRERVILGPTSCPRKYIFIFIICPYYPSCCPFLFSQVEPSQSSKVIFYSLPGQANNPKLKSVF